MHQTQKVILKRLSDRNGQKYSEVTKGYDFEDNIVFHLKKLMENNFVEKRDEKYFVTPAGTTEIHNYELSDLSNPGFKTFFVGIIVDDGNENYLIKSHPSAQVNFYNLPSCKPHFGERIEDLMNRMFLENTGVVINMARFSFVTIHNKMIKTTTGEILFDDGQAIFKVTINQTEKERMKLMENVRWYSKEEIVNLPNCWPEIEKCVLRKSREVFEAYEIVSDYKL